MYPDIHRARPRRTHAAGATRSLCVAAALIALVATSCDARPRYHVDGGAHPDAGALPDALPPSDAAGDLFAGMSISGCEAQDLTAETLSCSGTVPLTLSFSSLAPADALTFIWEFGDESTTVDLPSTTHVYTEPGTYTVLLVVGGPFGSISPPYLTQVEVAPAPMGAYCALDTQCAEGLCLCSTADATECPSMLMGTCGAACTACPAETHCADLTVTQTPQAPPWRDEVCLPDCVEDGDCPREGFDCRELPALDSSLGRHWQPTCFPDVLSDVGQSCHDASDLADPTRCVSGQCADLGRFGLCTDNCGDTPCPSYATCVSFTAGPHAGMPACLARCSPDRPCTHDPRLSCESPNGAGDLGFTLLDPGEPAGQVYCAPRRCDVASDCPSATCDLLAGGFCQ